MEQELLARIEKLELQVAMIVDHLDGLCISERLHNAAVAVRLVDWNGNYLEPFTPDGTTE